MDSMAERPRLPTVKVYDVVVGVDYSKIAERALNAALDIAHRRPGSRIHVIAVAEGEGPRLSEDLTQDPKGQFLKEARTTLERYVDEQLSARPGIINRASVRVAVDVGKPAERIVTLAKEVNANLIVLGTHGKNAVERAVMGSVAESVLRDAPCSVLVVRGAESSN
jgi:nucleotide-binding universal stress UspA family protein